MGILNIDKDTLYNLYINEKLTSYEIGNIYNTSNTTVLNHLKKNGIKARKERRKLDLTGKIINKLTVTKLYTTQKDAIWECICKCGNIAYYSTHQLTSGKIYSCGCYFKEQVSKRFSKETGWAATKSIINRYKAGARQRNLDYALSDEEAVILLTGNCSYCGIEPQKSTVESDSTRKYVNGDFIYNGIDRIDSRKGYLINNCVSCCLRCNLMKRDIPQQEFLDHIEKIHNHQKQ